MNKDTSKYISKMELQPPVTPNVVKQVELELKHELPLEYKQFILESNGAEGMIGENEYLSIWPVTILNQRNQDYDVEKYTPGILYFGSDGGNTAYAFNFRKNSVPIIEISFDTIHIEEANELSESFYEFLKYLFSK